VVIPVGKVPGKKFLPTVLLLLAVFYVVKQPHAAAHTLNAVVDGLSNVAQSVTSFVNGIHKS